MIEANIRDGTQKSTGSATLSSLKKRMAITKKKIQNINIFLCVLM
jgi:hypothetical protein